MRRRKKLIAIGLVVLVALVAVLGGLKKSRGPKGIPVTVATLKSGKIVGKVNGPGVVNPQTRVDVSAHLPGEITRLAVQEGDAVKKGQLLLELDPTKFEAAVQEARAWVESQRSQVELARAQHEKAQIDLQRAVDLHERNLVSNQELDLAKTAARVEEARVRAQEQSSEQAQATLRKAQDDLDKCRYISPMDGIVSQLNVEKGEMAVVGTMNNPGTVLLSVSDLSRMEVETEIDETDVIDVALGQKADIKVDAFPDTTFAGSVVEIGNTAVTRNRGTQEEVTNFIVKVALDQRVPELRPGMTATVGIETAARESVVRLPLQAVVSRNPEKEKQAWQNSLDPGKGKKAQGTAEASEAASAADDESDKRVDGVYVFHDGRAEFVPVRTGISDERYVEAQSGLSGGERVVTGPYQQLRTLTSGERVREKSQQESQREAKAKS